MSDSESLETKRRSMVTSLPSDYSDVQPRSYDPDYISDISNKMQVPDTIPAYTDMNGDSLPSSYDDLRGHHMNVPERIIVAGGGHHIEGRPDITSLNLDGLPRSSYNDGVGLQTPPRTLTLEEQFPSLEAREDEVRDTPRRIPNGTMATQEMMTPSSGDSLMLHSGDEITQLRLQVERLSKRVHHLQEEQNTLAVYQQYTMIAGASLTALVFLYKLIT